MRVTLVQQAYALLWRDRDSCMQVIEARKLLLSTLTKDEQREALDWAKKIKEADL